MNILVLGFYDRHNLGDESYKHSFKNIIKGKLTFVCIDDMKDNNNISNYDVIILGGGDIINDYFNKHIQKILHNYKGLKIAFSVGFPYPSLIKSEYLNIYDYVFTRNECDVLALQKVIGSVKARYMPDAVFNIHRMKEITNDRLDLTRELSKDLSVKNLTCGVFLVQNLLKFPFVVEGLISVLKNINKKYKIIFYLFNTSGNPDENDLTISEHVASHLTNAIVDKKQYHAKEMLSTIYKLHYAVCIRYHAHVYCIMAKIPFLSISSSRKTKVLMEQSDLGNFQYCLPLNDNGTPTHFSTIEAKLRLMYSRNNKKKMIETMTKVSSKNRFLLRNTNINNLIDTLLPIETQVKSVKNLDNAAKLLSKLTVGIPESKYTWGIYDKLKNNYDMKEMITYLSNEPKQHTIITSDNTLGLYVDIDEYQSYKNAHRGGWYLAIENIASHARKNGIYCDFYVDKTFHWDKEYYEKRGLIPYTFPWTGFIHHTMDTTYSEYNTAALLKNNAFILSLDHCVALFTLSPSLTATLQNLLPNTKIYTLHHPTVKPTLYFNVYHYKNNLVHIGSWYRKSFSIYKLNVTNFNKFILEGKDMKNIIIPQEMSIKVYTEDDSNISVNDVGDLTLTPCRDLQTHIINDILKWLKGNYVNIIGYDNGVIYIDYDKNNVIEKFNHMKNSVVVLDKLSNEHYDKLLSESVVFLDLVDSAAVNTVIECIVRNTPIVINKTPGVLDMLGHNYPLYYDNLDEVPGLLNKTTIKKAHLYLRKIDKSKYDIDYFCKDLKLKL